MFKTAALGMQILLVVLIKFHCSVNVNGLFHPVLEATRVGASHTLRVRVQSKDCGC